MQGEERSKSWPRLRYVPRSGSRPPLSTTSCEAVSGIALAWMLWGFSALLSARAEVLVLQ